MKDEKQMKEEAGDFHEHKIVNFHSKIVLSSIILEECSNESR